MFKLFQSLFDFSSAGSEPYPNWLIEKAIERAVDGLDGRLRLVSGYKKKLRPSVIQAIDHVIKLIDEMPPAIYASCKQYGKNNYLNAFFPSADEMQSFFSNDHEICDYLNKLTDIKPERITCLLMMDRIEKNVFGIEMDGEIIRRDVPQVTVSFKEHQLIDPNDQDEETRKSLKRRAFDHLIELALIDVSSSQKDRLELEQQYSLLRRKVATFKKAGCGFDIAESGAMDDPASAQQQLDELETQLKTLPAKTELLNTSLDALIEVFSHAPEKLWSVPVSVVIDKMHIKRESPSDKATELLLNEFHSASGVTRTGLLVSYPTDELLPPKKFLSKTKH